MIQIETPGTTPIASGADLALRLDVADAATAYVEKGGEQHLDLMATRAIFERLRAAVKKWRESQ